MKPHPGNSLTESSLVAPTEDRWSLPVLEDAGLQREQAAFDQALEGMSPSQLLNSMRSLMEHLEAAKAEAELALQQQELLSQPPSPSLAPPSLPPQPPVA